MYIVRWVTVCYSIILCFWNLGQASAQKAEAGESGAWASEALSQKKQKTKPKNNNNNKKFNILKFATQWRKKTRM